MHRVQSTEHRVQSTEYRVQSKSTGRSYMGVSYGYRGQNVQGPFLRGRPEVGEYISRERCRPGAQEMCIALQGAVFYKNKKKVISAYLSCTMHKCIFMKGI